MKNDRFKQMKIIRNLKQQVGGNDIHFFGGERKWNVFFSAIIGRQYLILNQTISAYHPKAFIIEMRRDC